MRNRNSLVLMELLVMVLVFALAAALCLGLFVRADRISRETARRDEAVLLAQNGAEVLKNCQGDPETAAKLLGGRMENETVIIESGAYTMVLTPEDSGTQGLGQAKIEVYEGEQLLFSLQTGWQEVDR